MELRRAGPNDATNLAALGAATFSETFGHLYKAEDLQYFLKTTHSVDSYSRALASEHHPIWVMEEKGQLTAYIMLCPNGLPCEPPRPEAIELSKLYALPAYQGQGLGAQLLMSACEWARHQGHREMVLSVYADNIGGQRFYARHGFEKIGDYLFPVGEQLDREWILLKRL